jgi:hypothetical protein
MTPAPQPLFREVQRFRQPWLWALLVAATALTAVRLAQSIRGMPLVIAGQPVDAAAWAVALAVCGLAALLFLAARLETEVWPDALAVRFFPFHLAPRRFPWDRLAAAEAVRYRPIRDYGGWGIRFGLAGRAYNVRGDRGVMLVFSDGKRLLVGSQRAEELAAAIAAARAGL